LRLRFANATGLRRFFYRLDLAVEFCDRICSGMGKPAIAAHKAA